MTNSTTLTLTARVELMQLQAIVADCRDLEEPVPARVRKRLAEIRRQLKASRSEVQS